MKHLPESRALTTRDKLRLSPRMSRRLPRRTAAPRAILTLMRSQLPRDQELTQETRRLPSQPERYPRPSLHPDLILILISQLPQLEKLQRPSLKLLLQLLMLRSRLVEPLCLMSTMVSSNFSFRDFPSILLKMDSTSSSVDTVRSQSASSSTPWVSPRVKLSLNTLITLQPERQ